MPPLQKSREIRNFGLAGNWARLVNFRISPIAQQ